MTNKILTSLLLLSLICVVLVGAETNSTSQSITNQQIGTDVITTPVCNEGTPSFSITPLIKTGLAGNTLNYKYTLENDNADCNHRWFSLVISTPRVIPTNMTLEYCQDNFMQCQFTTSSCLDVTTEQYPSGWCGSIFKLESGESAVFSVNLTSKNNWPEGNYIIYQQFYYSPPGQEGDIDFSQNERLNFTYKISQTSSCKVGCTCDSEGNLITCQDVVCPSSCICNGDTITCPSEQQPTVTTKVQGSTSSTSTQGETRTTSTISLSKVGKDKTSIQSGNIEVITSKKVSVTNSKLTIHTSSGSTKEIKVMPEEISEILGTSSIETIGLEEESEKAVYSVSGSKKGKIITIFPIEMKIQAKVNAETGEIISLKKPWWSFLAKEE